MSNQEKLINMANTLDESTLGSIVSLAENYLHHLEEVLDDAYCAKLLEESRNDPESREFSSFDDFVRELRGASK